MTTKDVGLPYSWEISKSDGNGERPLFQGATRHSWVNIYGAKHAKGQNIT